jgi:23S rRNA G2445 N2-methylase RlmL
VCFEEAQACLSSPIFPAKERPTLSLKDNCVEIANINYRELLALTMRMTTARDILWIIAEGRADSLQKLKKKLAQVPWDFYVSRGERWSVRANSRASRVFHEGIIKQLAQIELETRGCTLVPAKDADQRLDIRIDSDRIQIAVSVSGRFLFRRRYKSSFQSIAPLKEDLAAGLVRVGWGEKDFVPSSGRTVHIWIPFAGSGTLAFESILFIGQIAPEVFFGELGAESFPCTPKASTQFARKILRSKWSLNDDSSPCWHLVEMDGLQFEALQENVDFFSKRLSDFDYKKLNINLAQSDVFSIPPPTTKTGDLLFVLLNPPYGERLSTKKAALKIYAKIGLLLSDLPKNIEVRGGILVPEESSLQVLTNNLQLFQTSSYAVRQGGKKISIVAFSRQFHGLATPGIL